MINLDRILMVRAQEQMEKTDFTLLDIPKSKPGRSPSCHCDVCPKCRKRIAMAAWRQGPTGRRGPRTDMGKKCKECKRPLANHNKSGFCADHFRTYWNRNVRKSRKLSW